MLASKSTIICTIKRIASGIGARVLSRLLALVCLSGLLGSPLHATITVTEVPKEQLAIFAKVYQHIKDDYVESVDNETLFFNAINGMVTGLDESSDYYTKEELARAQENVAGETAGIGVVLEAREQQVIVISTLDGSPARAAGIKAGDIVVSVDGVPADAQQIKEIDDWLVGDAGSEVTLVVIDQDAERAEYTLTREKIDLDYHAVNRYKSIATIRFGRFSEKTTARLQAEIESQVQNGAEAFILDLRNNPGGLIDQAISIVDLFLDEGDIVSTAGRQDEINKRYFASAGDVLDGLPLMILINKGSASAAEIVAGSLQVNNRALVVGQTSYGKASIQSMIALPNGEGLKLTIGEYLLPNGEPISRVGVQPDVKLPKVELDADDLLESFESGQEYAKVDISQLTAKELDSFFDKQLEYLEKTDPNMLQAIRMMQAYMHQ